MSFVHEANTKPDTTATTMTFTAAPRTRGEGIRRRRLAILNVNSRYCKSPKRVFKGASTKSCKRGTKLNLHTKVLDFVKNGVSPRATGSKAFLQAQNGPQRGGSWLC